jgi:hypothetical protein
VLKKTHMLRCAQSPRSNVLPKYASARRFFARLASQIFLSSLPTEFFSSASLGNPLNPPVVIPGKLAIASATRNPGSQKSWFPAFAGVTGGEGRKPPQKIRGEDNHETY